MKHSLYRVSTVCPAECVQANLLKLHRNYRVPNLSLAVCLTVFRTVCLQANLVKLQRNFRSTGHLVHAAAALISINGKDETSCATETPNQDGEKIKTFSVATEQKEVQVRRSPPQLRVSRMLHLEAVIKVLAILVV